MRECVLALPLDHRFADDLEALVYGLSTGVHAMPEDASLLPRTSVITSSASGSMNSLRDSTRYSCPVITTAETVIAASEPLERRRTTWIFLALRYPPANAASNASTNS